ncbi:alpha/beta hydrolase [archaeon]|jgi:esterase/lipase|nr:alpha/beta hydrolase [archaeon]MBT4022200.1 alpha/beta hydrolase [archaeon]MBT4272813.1 alpha/beta hydrolase [archaeon]MBT4461612.1 alpha/beta hydrolase [archaeon]MBT4857620.1 alpha/beta hydrolase [archaeon]
MKTALIIHGWPCYIENNHPLVELLKKEKFKISAPKLFKKKYTKKSVLNQINSSIKKQPEIIIGISLGGTFAQILAKKYPKSKLLLIATGPYLKPKAKILYDFARFFLLSDILFLFIKFMPWMIIHPFYKIILPIIGKNYSDYINDMKTNILSMKKVKYSVYRNIIKYAFTINNEPMLSKIKNKTMIITGKKDIMMPPELSKLMHQKIKNSKLYEIDAQHHNLFNDKVIKKIKEFVI